MSDTAIRGPEWCGDVSALVSLMPVAVRYTASRLDEQGGIATGCRKLAAVELIVAAC